MECSTKQAFFHRSAWQAMLDGQTVFSSMLPGAGIGILRKAELNDTGGKMLVWQAAGDRMIADYQSFSGFRDARVDLLFIADEEAIEGLYRYEGADPLCQMKDFIRRGNILFYVLKTKDELLDLGYEDLLETLGLPFIGACR